MRKKRNRWALGLTALWILASVALPAQASAARRVEVSFPESLRRGVGGTAAVAIAAIYLLVRLVQGVVWLAGLIA